MEVNQDNLQNLVVVQNVPENQKLINLRQSNRIPLDAPQRVTINATTEGIYTLLMKNCIRYKDIQYLPVLSRDVIEVLNHPKIQEALQGNTLCPVYKGLETLTFNNVIDKAQLEQSAEQILQAAHELPKQSRKLAFALSALFMLGGLIISFLEFGKDSKIKVFKFSKESVSKNLTYFYLSLIGGALALHFVLVYLFRNLIRAIVKSIDYFFALDAKVNQLPRHPESDYFQKFFLSDSIQEEAIEKSNSHMLYPLLLNAGIINQSFIDNVELSFEQSNTLTHPATFVMLTAYQHAIKLSDVLKVVGTISKNQAYVLSNPFVYEQFRQRFPYKILPNSKNLKRLIDRVNHFDAQSLVSNERIIKATKQFMLIFLSLIFYPLYRIEHEPLFIKNFPKTDFVVTQTLAPLITLLTIEFIGRWAHFANSSFDCFDKRYQIEENCFLITYDDNKPQKFLMTDTQERQPEDEEAGVNPKSVRLLRRGVS